MIVDNTPTSNIALTQLKKVTFNKNTIEKLDGGVAFHGKTGGHEIDSCEVMHNYFEGKATMLTNSALTISNCKAVTLTSNTFKNIGAMSANTLGEATAVKLYSYVAWTLTARFNLFAGNNADLFIQTKWPAAITQVTHVIPGAPSRIEYNRFQKADNKFAIAMVDLVTTGGKDGAVIANGDFNP